MPLNGYHIELTGGDLVLTIEGSLVEKSTDLLRRSVVPLCGRKKAWGLELADTQSTLTQEEVERRLSKWTTR